MEERVVILAGGKGTRLAPFTTVLPKPLMPIGDRAILDIVLQQLSWQGFRRFTIAVGHLAHVIRAVIGDGSALGVTIDYHEEDVPLGTAGPLAVIADPGTTFLAMNGDVLTTLDYRRLVEAHHSAGNVATIATHRRVVRTEYGVLHLKPSNDLTQRVVDYEEKPELAYTVSMGVYVFEPEVLKYVPAGERFDVPDLILALLKAERPVGAYLYDGYWLDIGRHDDYQQALDDQDEIIPQLLGGPDRAP